MSTRPGPLALRGELEVTRQDFLAAVEDLRVTARRRLSPAERIRANPRAWLAGAFLVGLWLGSRGRRP